MKQAAKIVTFADLADFPSTHEFVSEWLVIDQPMIDAFAAVTRDLNPVHTAPALMATQGRPTIAHGFLLLSLLVGLSEHSIKFEATRGYNYGFDRMRFTSPVPVDSRVRLRQRIVAAAPRRDGLVLTRRVSVEILGEDKPALAGDWLTLVYP
jgi:acyl dehydratase